MFEAISAAAAAGTFIVITASAIAALVQLRHMRVSNQLDGLLTFLQILQSEEMRRLLNYVRHDLKERMKDRSYRDDLLEVPVDRSRHPELYVCQFFDHIGAHVRSGLIEPDVLLRTAWYDVLLYWTLLEPVICLVRESDRPFVFENFEYLGALAQRWKDDHPRGDYPAGIARMT